MRNPDDDEVQVDVLFDALARAGAITNLEVLRDLLAQTWAEGFEAGFAEGLGGPVERNPYRPD